MYAINGGYEIRDGDDRLIAKQRAITKAINESFIQVGAVFLKMNGKIPIAEDWHASGFRDTNLQDWIDDEALRFHNTGFNLQFGWTDIDIDTDDPEYNDCLIAALDHLGVDTRFRFGRLSVGRPTHVLVQLGEEESSNFDKLVRFEPKKFTINGKQFRTQLRSYSTNTTEKNVERTAKQTVMPGSIYAHKKKEGDYDISVWYRRDGSVAEDYTEIAATTPRRVSYNELVRAIAFATFLYVVRNRWVEGERQATATKVAGWLVRVVNDSRAMNNHEVISNDVFCPVDDDSIVESLFHFVCDYLGDEEAHMRIRAYYDAQTKLERNPDAKIPGWPAMETLFGSEAVLALRTVFSPGSDVSVLNVMADRYIYDESDNLYIDRKRHAIEGQYVYESGALALRHKSDIIRINGKSREAFRVFESSDMRKRVDHRSLYPDLAPGGIFRLNLAEEVMADDDESDSGMVVFNTWRGWPIPPAENVDTALQEEAIAKLDRLLGYMTQDNKNQIEWNKDNIAWIFQNPGKKQQIAPVCVGGQGVGKSFFGNTFMQALMGRLWGSASPKVMDTGFSVEPFIDKMFVFIDEAKFHGDTSTDEIKKLIRNVDIGGAEKFQSARTYRIFSRLMFASNRYDMGVGQTGVVDRALFYMKAYDHEYMGMTEMNFRAWTETLKPWFQEYAAFLERREVREQYVRYFMDRPVNKYDVESIKYSSSNDETILVANMSWPRRLAKRIIEDGYIMEGVALEVPFTERELNERVNELVKEMGMRSVQGSRVLAEFQQAGVIGEVRSGFKRAWRFNGKLGTVTKLFGDAIGIQLRSQFEFTDDDFGVNDAEIGARISWKGVNPNKPKF